MKHSKHTMLKASNTWPWLLAPSPYRAKVQVFSPMYFCAKDTPAPTGTWAPTMPFPPKKDGVNMCIDPPLPFDMPIWRPSSSPMTPLMVPPRMTAKGWHRYAVIMRSSLVIACSRPTDTASWDYSEVRMGVCRLSSVDWISAYLTNRQMAESTNEFRFIQSVSSHLHSSHGLHLLVHGEQTIFGDFHVEFWRVAEVGTEGVFMKPDCECSTFWRLNMASLDLKWLKQRVWMTEAAACTCQSCRHSTFCQWSHEGMLKVVWRVENRPVVGIIWGWGGDSCRNRKAFGPLVGLKAPREHPYCHIQSHHRELVSRSQTIIRVFWGEEGTLIIESAIPL